MSCLQKGVSAESICNDPSFSFFTDEIMQQEIRPLLAVDIIEQLHRQFALLSGKKWRSVWCLVCDKNLCSLKLTHFLPISCPISRWWCFEFWPALICENKYGSGFWVDFYKSHQWTYITLPPWFHYWSSVSLNVKSVSWVKMWLLCSLQPSHVKVHVSPFAEYQLTAYWLPVKIYYA